MRLVTEFKPTGVRAYLSPNLGSSGNRLGWLRPPNRNRDFPPVRKIAGCWTAASKLSLILWSCCHGNRKAVRSCCYRSASATSYSWGYQLPRFGPGVGSALLCTLSYARVAPKSPPNLIHFLARNSRLAESESTTNADNWSTLQTNHQSMVRVLNTKLNTAKV